MWYHLRRQVPPVQVLTLRRGDGPELGDGRAAQDLHDEHVGADPARVTRTAAPRRRASRRRTRTPAGPRRCRRRARPATARAASRTGASPRRRRPRPASWPPGAARPRSRRCRRRRRRRRRPRCRCSPAAAAATAVCGTGGGTWVCASTCGRAGRLRGAQTPASWGRRRPGPPRANRAAPSTAAGCRPT